MKTFLAILLMAATAQAQSFDAWENYHSQYGNYFDRFFNKPRVMVYAPDPKARAATLRLMAQRGSLR